MHGHISSPGLPGKGPASCHPEDRRREQRPRVIARQPDGEGFPEGFLHWPRHLNHVMAGERDERERGPAAEDQQGLIEPARELGAQGSVHVWFYPRTDSRAAKSAGVSISVSASGSAYGATAKPPPRSNW